MVLHSYRRKWSASVIKVCGQMHSDTFKRRPALSFTVIFLALNNLLLLLKSFITEAQEFKADLSFKIIFMCCYAFLSDEFLFICNIIVYL